MTHQQREWGGDAGEFIGNGCSRLEHQHLFIDVLPVAGVNTSRSPLRELTTTDDLGADGTGDGAIGNKRVCNVLKIVGDIAYTLRGSANMGFDLSRDDHARAAGLGKHRQPIRSSGPFTNRASSLRKRLD